MEEAHIDVCVHRAVPMDLFARAASQLMVAWSTNAQRPSTFTLSSGETLYMIVSDGNKPFTNPLTNRPVPLIRLIRYPDRIVISCCCRAVAVADGQGIPDALDTAMARQLAEELDEILSDLVPVSPRRGA